MRKKIITMAATLLLLGLLSAVEQMAVKRLTDDAMARTQEILSLLAQNQTARGLEQRTRDGRLVGRGSAEG